MSPWGWDALHSRTTLVFPFGEIIATVIGMGHCHFVLYSVSSVLAQLLGSAWLGLDAQVRREGTGKQSLQMDSWQKPAVERS